MQARTMKPNANGGYDFTFATNMGMGSDLGERFSPGSGRTQCSQRLAALSVASVLGLPLQEAATALGQFTGTGRRFDVRGRSNGVLLVDDYAHHPTEIRATLAGARARYPNRRIWAVWQPHTYSRTQTLKYEFSQAFKDADKVLVTEIYASREPKQDFSSAELSVPCRIHRRCIAARCLKRKITCATMSARVMVIVLSAGDADRITADLLKEL